MNRHYENADTGQLDGGMLTDAGLVCEATLALAYEQRTANLINYMFHADGDEYGNVKAEIRERLGF